MVMKYQNPGQEKELYKEKCEKNCSKDVCPVDEIVRLSISIISTRKINLIGINSI